MAVIATAPRSARRGASHGPAAAVPPVFRRSRSAVAVAAVGAAFAVLGTLASATFLPGPLRWRPLSSAGSGSGRFSRSGTASRVALRAEEEGDAAEAAEEDELAGFEEFEPKKEPVRYLPALDFDFRGELEAREGYQTIPCFPLGGMTYVPETTQVLNIFEPRYRQMYSDILLSGGRRFVVPQIEQDEETGEVRLAEVGVIFYLDDLREVSEQTQDQVKYVCQHSVVGRVRIKNVLNPRAFADRSTYLRVEAEEIVDVDADEDLSLDEAATMRAAKELDELQAKVGNEVRFSPKAFQNANATAKGFWNVVTLWQDKLNSKARLLQQRFQRELQETIVSYLKESNSEIPQQVTLGELPEEVQRAVVALQDQFRDEIQPLVKAQTEGVQELIQCDSHKNRLALFRELLSSERKRLEAKMALKSIFD